MCCKTGSFCGLIPLGGGGYKETMWEGEYGGNNMCSCMKTKWKYYILMYENV
jgi:hypothetical protein